MTSFCQTLGEPAGNWTDVRRREIGLAALVAVGLALAMHWPLPLHIGRDVARDLGDPLPQAWQVAWDGHALLHQPLDFFQANVFWPLKNSLAFSDALVGYAPAGVIGSGPHAAIVRYDLLFLFAYALAFLGAYLLARELGASRAGGFVAGAAFAYAPWRLEQDGHLHVLSSGGIALALFLVLALMDLKLWQLAGLAVPMLVILAAQIVLTVAYAALVTFPLTGRDYEAAVTASGHVGFGLGITANAVANMEALVARYAPAPRSFLVVPVVGAFFIDFTNALVITLFVNFL